MDNQASTVLHAQDNANNHNIKTKNSDNYHESGASPPKSSSIFMSLLIFCLILFANILFVYLVYGNNKELTDSVISIIPHNYRQGIVETLNKVGVFTFFERTSDIVRRTLGLEHFRIRTFDHADQIRYMNPLYGGKQRGQQKNKHFRSQIIHIHASSICYFSYHSYIDIHYFLQYFHRFINRQRFTHNKSRKSKWE